MESAARRILQSTVVGVVALVMCIITIVVVQQTTVVPTPSLADRLPATGALLFVKGTSMEDLAGIDRLLTLEARLTTPLPKLGSGAYELAVLERAGTWQWVLQTVRGNEVSISGPAADALLPAAANRSLSLTYLPHFRRMTRQVAPAVWMDTKILTLTDNHSDRLLGAMLEPYSHILTGSTPRTLVLLRNEPATLPSRPAGPLGHSPAGSLDLLDPALNRRLDLLGTALNDDAPALYEGLTGILAQAWQRELGAVTAEAVTKLAAHVAGVRVQPGSGATLAFAVALQDVQQKEVDALLQSFAAELPQTAVRNLELKLNTRTDVTVDADAVERGSEDVAGWQLQWVQSRNVDRRLAAATRGARTLLSADVGLLRSMIAETVPISAGTGTVKALPAQAGGTLDTALFTSAVSRNLPLFERDTASFFWRMMEAVGNVRWTLFAQTDADVITIESAQ